MNDDGSYEEWIANDSAKNFFEELYHLAWDIRKLAESPMARNQRRLERLTLKDPHFQKMF
jgi:alpha-amylase/alpha-mannosidase (GH57 family)